MMQKWQSWWQRQDKEAVQSRAIQKIKEGIIDDYFLDDENGIVEVVRNLDGSKDLEYKEFMTRAEAKTKFDKENNISVSPEKIKLTNREENILERGDAFQNADKYDRKARMQMLREEGKFSTNNAKNIVEKRSLSEELRGEAESNYNSKPKMNKYQQKDYNDFKDAYGF